jgi:transglutaminase-like putative cysteine protease
MIVNLICLAARRLEQRRLEQPGSRSNPRPPVSRLVFVTAMAVTLAGASTAAGQPSPGAVGQPTPRPAGTSTPAGPASESASTVDAIAADQRALAELDGFFQKSVDARRRGAPADELRFLQAALAVQHLPPKAGTVRGFIQYQIASAEARLGRVEGAFRSLEQAGVSGYDDAEDAESDPDLLPLHADPRFQRAISAFQRNQLELRVYDVVRFDSPDLGWAHLHEFEDIASPFFDDLRTRYHLDEVVHGRKSETERQLALTAWVHQRWQHSGLSEPSHEDALTILREVAAGKRYRCVEYSVVLAQVLQSMGYPARVVSLGMDGLSFGIGKSHVVTEAWNNELGKWILLDGQNNGTWTLDGALLSAAEVRQVRRSSPERLRFTLGPSSWRPAKPEPEQRADWSRYFEYLTFQLKNVQPGLREGAPEQVDLLYPGARYELLFQGVVRERRVQVADIEKVYPALGRVHMDISATDPGKPELMVQLTNSMPWFSHYRIRQGGKERTSRDPRLAWQLEPGRNELVVHAVNRMKVEGRPSSIALDFFPRRAQPPPTSAAR